MTAKQRKDRVSTEPVIQSPSIDPAQLTKRRLPIDSMHLNLRLAGESAQIYGYLEKCTPGITDSLRIRDCIRIAAFLIGMKEKGEPVLFPRGNDPDEDLLEHIGAFFPQTPMDMRRRVPKS